MNHIVIEITMWISGFIVGIGTGMLIVGKYSKQ